SVCKWQPESSRRATEGGAGKTSPPRLKSCLFDFDLGASFFQLLLGGIGFRFGNAFEHGLGGAFNERLGFGQTEAGLDFTNGLDDSDFLVSSRGGQDDIERCFGFGGSGSGTGSTASGGG